MKLTLIAIFFLFVSASYAQSSYDELKSTLLDMLNQNASAEGKVKTFVSTSSDLILTYAYYYSNFRIHECTLEFDAYVQETGRMTRIGEENINHYHSHLTVDLTTIEKVHCIPKTSTSEEGERHDEDEKLILESGSKGIEDLNKKDGSKKKREYINIYGNFFADKTISGKLLRTIRGLEASCKK